MEKHSIQAVIFDMDGLILDSQRMATEAWKRTVSEFGCCLTDELTLTMIGRNVHDVDEILRSAFGSGFPLNEVRRLVAKRLSEITKDTGVPIKKGLWELLEFLDARGIAGAVATSTPRAQCIRLLQRSNLTTRFRVIVCGDEVTKGKPAPDLFLKASELLQAAPDRCVVLEDSFVGIRAASAAGMVPIMVPDLREADNEMRQLARAIVSDLHGAKDMIAGLMKGK